MTLEKHRYGNLLFDICQDVIRTGKKGCPKTTLAEGVKDCLKNKGAQAHKTGPSLPKYQTPQPEHPSTRQNIEDEDIHAN